MSATRSGIAVFATFALSLLLGLAACSRPQAKGEPASATETVVIIHTNDIHDHLGPGFGGMGGLPYLSGMIRELRARHPQAVVVDAGDVVEKGDLIAFLSHGDLTYEAMGRIGYDAIAIGNHDHNLARDYPPQGWFELDKLHDFHALSGGAFLALNLMDAEGNLYFPASRIVQAGKARIALIGLALPRDEGTLDFEESGQALAVESERLRAKADLIIVTCHVGREDAIRWSRMAPEVDIFVTGHTHEVLPRPVVAETGAIIVQAGYNALWVGELEVEVDLEKGGVRGHRGQLHFMCHDSVPVDEEMLAWFFEKQEELYPGADKIVTHLEEPIGWFGIARLTAEALRQHAGADLGFCHPTHVVRNSLPEGPADVNMLFRTSADRGHPLIKTRLTGRQVETYLNGLAAEDYRAFGLTQWAGFFVELVSIEDEPLPYWKTDLEPDRTYSVILPEREWEKRLMRLVENWEEKCVVNALTEPRPVGESPGFSKIDALVPYIKALQENGDTIHQRLRALREAQGAADPMEAILEPRLIQRVADKETLQRRTRGE